MMFIRVHVRIKIGFKNPSQDDKDTFKKDMFRSNDLKNIYIPLYSALSMKDPNDDWSVLRL